MSSSDKKFIADWEKTNSKGPLKFILRIALFSGVFMFLFMSAMELSDHTFSEAFLSRQAASRLLIYLIAGFAVGAGSWYINQYNYKQKKAAQ